MENREARRHSFGPVAREYLAARPGYPAALIDDLLDAAALGPEDEVLEVGTGPGVVTRVLAERGLRVLGVDIGPELIEVAREHVREFPDVQLEVRDFNAWTPPAGRFGLVTSGQAWHWIDDATGCPKVSAALTPGGLFAPFWNYSVTLAAQLVEAYATHAPELVVKRPYPGIDARIQQRTEKLEETGAFASIEVRRYPWTLRHDADGYVALIGTYSDHIVMDPDRRAVLFDAIRARIDREGGVIERPLEALLFLCRPA